MKYLMWRRGSHRNWEYFGLLQSNFSTDSPQVWRQLQTIINAPQSHWWGQMTPSNLKIGTGLFTYIISPNFSLVWIREQLLWSLVVTARRRRGGTRGGTALSSSDNVRLFPIRTIGDDPRLLVDICRPATPPNILQREKNGNFRWKEKSAKITGFSFGRTNEHSRQCHRHKIKWHPTHQTKRTMNFNLAKSHQNPIKCSCIHRGHQMQKASILSAIFFFCAYTIVQSPTRDTKQN